MVKTTKRDINDDGFSILDLVVAVSVLLILSLGGIMAYNSIQERARVAKAENVAEEVYNAAEGYSLDNDRSSNAYDAENQWEDTDDDSQLKVEVLVNGVSQETEEP